MAAELTTLAGAAPMGESRRRPAAPLPHPRRLGPLKGLRIISANPIAFFAEEAYQRDFVEYKWLGGLLLINDPDAVETIFANSATSYVKSNQYLQVLVPALGEGLLTAEGETWQATRRIAAPVLNPRGTARMVPGFCERAQAMVRRWHERDEPDEPLDLSAEMLRLTYEIISGTVFSGALDEHRDAIHANMARYFETIGRPDIATAFNLPVWVPTLNKLRALPTVRVLRSIIDRVVKGRIEDERKSADLLSKLIDGHDPKSGVTLSHEIVCDNVRTFLAAGHDTTGNALTWVLYLLALHPAAEAHVLEELAKVLGDAAPSAEGLSQLVFTRAVVNEALRLYPPVPITGRQALREIELHGRRIKPTTPLLISSWVVHRHRALWQNPDYFEPERFLPPADIRRGAFIPFGLGPRVCIGMGFAMQEILIVLATILPRFRIRLANAEAVFPEMNVTLSPAGGLPAFVTPRT